MTAVLYGADFSAAVDGFLVAGGRAMTLRKNALTRNADRTTTAVPSDATCTGRLQAFRQRDIDGTRVLTKDRQAVVSAAGVAVAPAKGDELVVDGETWQVVEILKTVAPAGVTIYWLLQVRR